MDARVKPAHARTKPPPVLTLNGLLSKMACFQKRSGLF
jgi:hypothetical protein